MFVECCEAYPSLLGALSVTPYKDVISSVVVFCLLFIPNPDSQPLLSHPIVTLSNIFLSALKYLRNFENLIFKSYVFILNFRTRYCATALILFLKIFHSTLYFLKCAYLSARTSNIWFITVHLPHPPHLTYSVPLMNTCMVSCPPPTPKHYKILTLSLYDFLLVSTQEQYCWITGDTQFISLGTSTLLSRVAWQAVSHQQYHILMDNFLLFESFAKQRDGCGM